MLDRTRRVDSFFFFAPVRFFAGFRFYAQSP